MKSKKTAKTQPKLPTLDDALVAEAAATTSAMVAAHAGAKQHGADVCHALVRAADRFLYLAAGYVNVHDWASDVLDLTPPRVRVFLRVGRAFTREEIAAHGVTKLDAVVTYRLLKEKLGERVDVRRETITVTNKNGTEERKLLLQATTRQIVAASRALRARIAAKKDQHPGKKKADQLAECMNAATVAEKLDDVRSKAIWSESSRCYVLEIRGVPLEEVTMVSKTLRALARAADRSLE